MREPIVIDNLFDDEFHNLIINELKYKAKWTLSFDDIPQVILMLDLFATAGFKIQILI